MVVTILKAFLWRTKMELLLLLIGREKLLVINSWLPLVKKGPIWADLHWRCSNQQDGIQMSTIPMLNQLHGEKAKDVDFWVLITVMERNFVKTHHSDAIGRGLLLENATLIHSLEPATFLSISQTQFASMKTLSWKT